MQYFYKTKDNEIIPITKDYFACFNSQNYTMVRKYNIDKEHEFYYSNEENTAEENIETLRRKFEDVLKKLAGCSEKSGIEDSNQNFQKLKKLYTIGRNKYQYMFPCFREGYDADHTRAKLTVLTENAEGKKESGGEAIPKEIVGAKYNIFVDIDELVMLSNNKLYLGELKDRIKNLLFHLMHGLNIEICEGDIYLSAKKSEDIIADQNFVAALYEKHCDFIPGDEKRAIKFVKERWDNIYQTMEKLDSQQEISERMLRELIPRLYKWDYVTRFLKSSCSSGDGNPESEIETAEKNYKKHTHLQMAVKAEAEWDSLVRWSTEWPYKYIR